MYGDNFAKELQSIPLSNDTVSRRIDDIAEDVEQQLFGKLRDKLFSIQLDEATDNNNDAHLIAYFRFGDGLREAGWSNRRIGRHLGQSDMVVARCWQQWITEGRVYRRGVVRTHPVPSRETIRRRLTEVGLRSRRPLRRLPLTPHHRQCRLDFCRPQATWSVTDWRRVIFSDESRFSLSDDDHRTRVWRRTGQRSDPAFIVERHTAISQGVTVWGAISWDTRSSLVVLQGTLTARRYVDDILTPIVLPMLSSRPGAIYQQDNARPHTARLSQQCLQRI
ncbi:HTH_Tnp_Tc3_2 domain-containing protein [Trichonephila clavipes]|nr:HTH_Tnp_Tc3_2 domain-containing protein [Trichonephila clavipes]